MKIIARSADFPRVCKEDASRVSLASLLFARNIHFCRFRSTKIDARTLVEVSRCMNMCLLYVKRPTLRSEALTPDLCLI